MLMPKKTKYRKMMKGRMKGTETRGTEFEFGRYALKALEPGWITSRQVTFGLKYSRINRLLQNLLKLVWVQVKVTLNTG